MSVIGIFFFDIFFIDNLFFMEITLYLQMNLN